MPCFFKHAGAETFRRGKTSQDHGKKPRHVRAGLRHRDSWFQAGKRTLAEIAQLGLIAIPLEGQEQRGILLIEKVKSLAAARR